MTVDVNLLSTDIPNEIPTHSDRLFIYGSMFEGRVHHGRISEFIVEKTFGFLKGSVYRLESGFPVYAAEGADSIPGTIVQLSSTATLWTLLDELNGYSPMIPEKSLFHRLVATAETEAATMICQVYAINPNKMPRSSSRILGGDWIKDLEDREPMVNQLTPNQRNYIQKLGRSTGRDIVPINLDLYRELMNKGLIVDKGRRLALTNLGQEVFRYLE